MRRWPPGPMLAAIWFVLCGVYLLRVLGWDTFTALTPLDQLLYAALAVLPVPVFWGAAAMRRRAQEFSTVSAKLADQLDRLYTPSDERDQRAQEALLALRRQAEELAGAVDNTVKRIESSAEGLGTRLTDSMKAAMGETNRRRAIQIAYNTEHGITPITIKKAIHDITDQMRSDHDQAVGDLVVIDSERMKSDPKGLVREKEEQMADAVRDLDFETAAILRDEILVLRKKFNLVSPEKGRGRKAKKT